MATLWRTLASQGALVVMLLGAVMAAGSARAQSVTETNNPTTLTNALTGGPSVTISNLTTTGNSRQFGTFTGANGVLGMPDGVFISTGRGTSVFSSPGGFASTGNLGSTPDTDLTGITPSAVFDTATVYFRVVSNSPEVVVRFVFASEEYPEYVCSAFNDAFGLFARELGGGQPYLNYAFVPNTFEYVGINTINFGPNNNGGNCGTPNNVLYHNTNSTIGAGTITAPNLVYDGYTVPIEFNIPVTPGQTYEFKFVIADSGDTGFDSAIFIDYIGTDWTATADMSLQLVSSESAPAAGAPFQITATVTNDGPNNVNVVQVSDIVPDGLTFLGVASGGAYDPATDVWTITSGVASGASETLVLNVSAPDGELYQTTAEITLSQANDPDSTPGNALTTTNEDDTATIFIGGGQSLSLGPDHQASVQPGTSLTFPHRLVVGDSLDGGALAFSLTSSLGWPWRVFLDIDGDGALGEGDAEWTNGDPIAAGEYGVLVHAVVPQDADPGLVETLEFGAAVSFGAYSQSASVTDAVIVTDPGGGVVVGRKWMALDTDCDGSLADEAPSDAVYEIAKDAAPGGCVVYRVGFENTSARSVTMVSVRDAIPAFTSYISGSALYEETPSGVTPGSMAGAAPGASGPLLGEPASPAASLVEFPFSGAIAPGESGSVRFSVRIDN